MSSRSDRAIHSLSPREEREREKERELKREVCACVCTEKERCGDGGGTDALFLLTLSKPLHCAPPCSEWKPICHRSTSQHTRRGLDCWKHKSIQCEM